LGVAATVGGAKLARTNPRANRIAADRMNKLLQTRQTNERLIGDNLRTT
jgi:hypothetical protein